MHRPLFEEVPTNKVVNLKIKNLPYPFGTHRPWVRVPQPGPKEQTPLLGCLLFLYSARDSKGRPANLAGKK